MDDSGQPAGALRALLTENLGPPRRVVVRGGEQVFRIGEPARHVTFVVRGSVRLERTTPDGRPIVLRVAWPGEWLAEASLFGSEYHCDAVAECDGEIERFDGRSALEVLRRSPDTLLSVTEMLARALQRQRTMVEIRSRTPVAERILAFLALDTGGVGGRGRPLCALAAELGIADETLYRTLARLGDEGRIVRDHRGVRLADDPRS